VSHPSIYSILCRNGTGNNGTGINGTGAKFSQPPTLKPSTSNQSPQTQTQNPISKPSTQILKKCHFTYFAICGIFITCVIFTCVIFTGTMVCL